MLISSAQETWEYSIFKYIEMEMFGAKSHVNLLKMEVYIPLSVVSSAPVPHDSQKYEMDKYPITPCRGDLATSVHTGFMYSFKKV